MKTEHSYSAKGVLAALGRSALYLLFLWRCRFCCPLSMGSVSLPMRQSIGERTLHRGRRRWRSGFLTACRRSRCYRV